MHVNSKSYRVTSDSYYTTSNKTAAFIHKLTMKINKQQPKQFCLKEK